MNKLLLVVLFFSFLGMVFSRKLTEDLFLPNTKECLAELGVNLDSVYDNANADLLSIEDNVEIIKLCECLIKKLNAVDENNLIKVDVLKPIMVRYVAIINSDIGDTQQIANDAIQSCKDMQGNSPGHQLVKIWNCFVKYIVNVQIL